MCRNRFKWKTAWVYVCSCVLACAVTGCGQTAEMPESEKIECVTEESMLESSSEVQEQEKEETGFFSGIVPSDYIYFDQDYHTLRLAEDELYLAEENVQAEIDSFLLEHRNFEEIPEREAMFGDTVVLDFTGESNGEILYNEKDYNLELGMGIMPYGFEDALEGAKAGDEIILDLEYPEDYEDELLKGQKIHFDIQVHKVYMVSIPDYTDSFVAEHTEYSTVKEYEKAVKERIEIQAKTDAIAYWISEHAQMDTYPDELKKVYEERLLHSLKIAAEEEYQMSSKELLKQMGYATERAFLDKNSSAVLEELKSDLSYGCIAEQENIEYKEAEYQQYAKQFASENEYASLEKLYESVDQYTVRMNFLRELAMKKIMEYVIFE